MDEQTKVDKQVEFADNLVSEIQMNGGFDDLDVAIMLDSMAILGYVLAEASANPEVILIATGSEITLALEAREVLESEGVATRVVSMPCVEWFDEQTPAYRESVLPAAVRARVSVEAGIAQSWHRFIGDHGEAVSLEHFGASADYQTLYREFGITTDAVVAAAKKSLASVQEIG